MNWCHSVTISWTWWLHLNKRYIIVLCSPMCKFRNYVFVLQDFMRCVYPSLLIFINTRLNSERKQLWFKETYISHEWYFNICIWNCKLYSCYLKANNSFINEVLIHFILVYNFYSMTFSFVILISFFYHISAGSFYELLSFFHTKFVSGIRSYTCSTFYLAHGLNSELLCYQIYKPPLYSIFP